jgi:DNA-binding transcriptional LysR family regulator
VLKPLSRRRPERTIHLYNGDTPDLLFRLERGELDAVVASMRLTSPKITYATLHPEDYAFVSARDCLKERDDAKGLVLVDASRDIPLFRYFLDALPRSDPWPFAHIEYMGGIGNIRRRLLDEVNRVAVLPRYFIRKDLASHRLVHLMPRVRLRLDAFRLVWRAGHPRSSELLALAEDLRKFPLR